MSNPLIKGPFDLRRWERLTVNPGEAVVIETRAGIVELRPSQRLTRGEQRYTKGDYWRVSMRSPEQVLEMETPAANTRDVFTILLHYVVEVVEPKAFYANTSPDIDPLVEIQSKIRSGIRSHAAQFAPTDTAALQAALCTIEFSIPPYLAVSTTEVVVGVTVETRARLDAEAATADEVKRLELAAKVDEVSDNLAQKRRTRQEAHRHELITRIAHDYGLDLDPLMLRALALDSNQSPATVLQVRERLAEERFEDLHKMGDFLQALHEREMLPDEVFAVFMDFAKTMAVDSNRGVLRRPISSALSPTEKGVIEVEASEPLDVDDSSPTPPDPSPTED